MRILSVTFIWLFLAIGPVMSFAAGDRNIVPSNLISATVYLRGAELVHKASANLQQGNNELLIDDISNSIDEASIRVSCSGNVTILSVAYAMEYLKDEAPSALVRRLQDSIELLQRESSRLEVLIKSNADLLELLGANKSIGGTAAGVSVAELTKMMDYYKQKSVELRAEIDGWKLKQGQLSVAIERLSSQKREEEKKNGKTSGRIKLQLLSPSAGASHFTISYLTTAAYWYPFYDLRVDNATDPLHILYKAHLSQTTGFDWKKVKLVLSTSTPSQNRMAPVLSAWFMRFVDPARLDEVVVTGYGAANTASNDLSAPIVKGYFAAEKKKDRVSDYKAEPPVNIIDNQLDVSFDIDIPYDIPGTGKEQSVALKDLTTDCHYKYYCAPVRAKEAYLLGNVAGWEKLNLLPGEANIIVEGAFIGKTHIDPNSIQDTLNLTLGQDKRIVIRREKMTDLTSVKFLGSNKKQQYTYEITVRNNKKEAIEMVLKDQYPISTEKDIDIELTDNGGAEVNKETGVLTWKLQLAAGETHKYRISYTIKYPKDRQINL